MGDQVEFKITPHETTVALHEEDLSLPLSINPGCDVTVNATVTSVDDSNGYSHSISKSWTCFICDYQFVISSIDADQSGNGKHSVGGFCKLFDIQPKEELNTVPVESRLSSEHYCSGCEETLALVNRIYDDIDRLKNELNSYKWRVEEHLQKTLNNCSKVEAGNLSVTADHIDSRYRRRLRQYLIEEKRQSNARNAVDSNSAEALAGQKVESLEVQLDPVVYQGDLIHSSPSPSDPSQPAELKSDSAKPKTDNEQQAEPPSATKSRSRTRKRRRLIGGTDESSSEFEDDDKDQDFRPEDVDDSDEDYDPKRKAASVPVPAQNASRREEAVQSQSQHHDNPAKTMPPKTNPNVPPASSTTQPHIRYRKIYKKRCPADGCIKTFISMQGLNAHITSRHKNQAEALLKKLANQPKLPASRLVRKPTVYVRTAKHDYAGTSTICAICGKEYKSYESRRYHEQQHIPDSERPFVCSTCGKGFFKQSLLTKHEEIHIETTCEICGETITNIRAHLVTHSRNSNSVANSSMEKQVGEKLYECEVCHTKVATSYSLRAHQRIHTGERPYSCKICAMAFRTTSGLRRHHRVHNPEKPFQCQYCDKTFRSKQNLKEHVYTHTQELPHRCNICGRRYQGRELLDQHLSEDHTPEQIEKKKQQLRINRAESDSLRRH